MPKLGSFGTGSNKTVIQGAKLKSPTGQQNFLTPGTTTWTAPAFVTKVNAVVLSGGGGGGGVGKNGAGGGGGGVVYANNIPVSPGATYTINVGSGGIPGGAGGNSWFGPNGSTSASSFIYATGGGAGGYPAADAQDQITFTSSSGTSAVSGTTYITNDNGPFRYTTWTCPDGVFSVSMVCVGAGGGGGGTSTGYGGNGGGGGSLSWVKSTKVVPGYAYRVHIGVRGALGTSSNGGHGGDSSFFNFIGIKAIQTESTTNYIYLDFSQSTSGTTFADLSQGLFIVFSGTTFGGITSDFRYRIKSVVSPNKITITTFFNTGGTVYSVTSATGSMNVDVAGIIAFGGIGGGIAASTINSNRTGYYPGTSAGLYGGGVGGEGGAASGLGIAHGGGGGGAGGYSGTAGAGGGSTDEFGTSGQGRAGAGGGGGGGSSGISRFSSGTTAGSRLGGGGGGGVGITTNGSPTSGGATTTPVSYVNATVTTYGGVGGSPTGAQTTTTTNTTTSSAGASANSTGYYGGGGGGTSAPAGTGTASGAPAQDGVVRIIWGSNRYYLSTGLSSVANATVTTNTVTVYTGGGGGGAAGFTAAGGNGGGAGLPIYSGGAGGSGFKGTAFTGSITAYSGGAGGGSVAGDFSTYTVPTLNTNSGGGGSGGRGPYGGGGISYLRPTSVDSSSVSTAVGGSVASSGDAVSATNGGSGGTGGNGGEINSSALTIAYKVAGGYGGGGGGGTRGSYGSSGFVRLIYGPGRSYPDTFTYDLIQATQLVNGTQYKIATAYTTDFTLIGAANNNSGTIFTATGPGIGEGNAYVWP